MVICCYFEKKNINISSIVRIVSFFVTKNKNRCKKVSKLFLQGLIANMEWLLQEEASE